MARLAKSVGEKFFVLNIEELFIQGFSVKTEEKN
jgi:hypothetical protein